MSNIALPQKVEYTKGKGNTGTIQIMGCYPGYGTTLGNALRRVLLSSLEGAAVTAVRIKGVTHEFSGMDGVMEDAVQIILNLKKLNFRIYTDKPVILTLSAKGEGAVTAADIKTTSDIEIVDPKQKIATITEKKTTIEMELTVQKGVGYVPVDQQARDEIDLGSIAIDAVYTPIQRVNYNIENMRVGKRTDYEKVTLEIVTDGSTTAEEAFYHAVAILKEQVDALTDEGESE